MLTGSIMRGGDEAAVMSIGRAENLDTLAECDVDGCLVRVPYSAAIAENSRALTLDSL